MLPSGERGPAGKLVGHRGAVLSMTFTSGGKYCLTSGKDRTVRLWNPSRWLLVKTYGDAHGHEIRDVCCTGDNGRIASCGGDRQVFLYDVSTGRIIRRFRGHDAAPVNAVRFAASDQVLLSGGFDANLRAWDCRSQSTHPIQVMKEFKDSVTSIRVLEYEIMAASVDGSIRTFDVRMGQVVTDTIGPPVTTVGVSGDAKCTLAGLLDDRLVLLDRSSGETLAEYKGHQNSKLKVDCCLTHDDAYVVSGSEDGKVYFWDLVDAKIVRSFPVNPHGAATTLAWHPEGSFLLTSSSTGDISMWK